MYVLGIEAATPVAAVAVAGREGILAERMVFNKRTHSVNLLPMIKAVLEESEIDPRRLTGISVSGGPGSFTGLRIGMSTAKALAQVWELPVVGISTLDTLANAMAGHGRLVCPVLNARKNEVYAAVYESAGCGMEQLAGPVALPPGELTRRLLTYARPVTFLGDGVPVYRRVLEEGMETQARFAPLALNFPRGAVVAELGLQAFQEGRGSDPARLQPEYIRLSEAEVLWLKKHGRAPEGAGTTP